MTKAENSLSRCRLFPCMAISMLSGILFLLLLPIPLLAKIMVYEGNKSIMLDWDPPSTRISGAKLSSEQIAGYDIYRSTTTGIGYLKINKEIITTTSFLDRGLSNNTNYYYVLTTIDTEGVSSSYSREVEAVPKFIPPSDFTAAAGREIVTLTWSPYRLNEIRGYEIYRSEHPGGSYRKIASLLDNVSTFLDQDVICGKNYYYTITAVDLDWTESPSSNEVAATPLMITTEELARLEDIQGVEADIDGNTIIITWHPVEEKYLAGYAVYRRTNEQKALKITGEELLTSPRFEDREITRGATYYYTISAVDKEGHEAQFPREVRIAYDYLYITAISEDTEGKPKKGGDSITITITGTPGTKAGFEIKGINQLINMEETSKPGTYYGRYQVKENDNLSGAAILGYLFDPNGHSVSLECSTRLIIDTTPPSPVRQLESGAAVNESGMVVLSWQQTDDDKLDPLDHFRIYRSTSTIEEPLAEYIINDHVPPTQTTYHDCLIQPGQNYFYAITRIDPAGNESSMVASAKVLIPADTLPPKIDSVKELSNDALKTLGDNLNVLIIGEPGCKASFCLGERICQPAQETSLPGRYAGWYTIKEGDNLSQATSVRAILIDPSGNQSFLDGVETMAINTTQQGTPPEITQIQVRSYQEPLVAGDRLFIRVVGTPNCIGLFDLGVYIDEDGAIELQWEGFSASSFEGLAGFNLYYSDQPFTTVAGLKPVDSLAPGCQSYRLENYRGGYLAVTAKNLKGEEKIILTPRLGLGLREIEPGIYEGEYPVNTGDYLANARIYARLKSQAGLASSTQVSHQVTNIDTSVHLTVKPESVTLPADGRSASRIMVTALDAREGPVPDHEVSLDLFTTSEYTGIAGVGTFDHQDFGEIESNFQGKTDTWGCMEATYTAGKTAKTVIIRAIDNLTGDRGLACITSWVEGTVTLELLPTTKKRLRSADNGLYLTLKADHTWLTADGVSRTRILALVTDGNNKPVPDHQIVFSLTQGDGHVKTGKGITDQAGQSIAIYTAGTQIGTVEITAVDTTATAAISENIHIILRSDAPAMVEITADPVSLPADGFTTSEITAAVSDSHGNPNRGVRVEMKIIKGSGNIESEKPITDFFGQATAIFKAGDKPGSISILARVTSKIPTAKELDMAMERGKSF